MLFLHIC